MKIHPLTTLLLSFKKEVRLYATSLKGSKSVKHFSPTGVFMPYVLTSTALPVELMKLVREIDQCVCQISDFEEFYLAIESVAKLARLRYRRVMSYWLHGGNFFIQVSTIPNLDIDREMIRSASHRHQVKNNTTLLLREVASPIQLENVMGRDIQLELWVQGHSVHNAYPWAWVVNEKDKILDVTVGEGGECCPDFSCCNGQPGWSLLQREAFIEADEPTQWQMLSMSMQGLAQDVGVMTLPISFDYSKYNG